MASAGSPAIATPSMARMNRNIGHSPTNDDSSVSSAAASSERLMIGLRDHPSATAPMTSIETARQPVVTDSARLLVAASTWNSRVKMGSSGCTAYISRKTEKPAEKTARLIFQKALEPRATWLRWFGGSGFGVRGFAGSMVRGFTRSTACEGEADADVHGGEEDGLGQDRAIGDDELREERDVEDRDLRVQEIGKETLNKADMTRTYRA